MKNALKVLAAVAVIAPVQAYSATGNIPFNGSVTDTCVITVGSAGTIMPNTAYTVLSSKEAGGAAGTATILATGNGYSVSADAPTAWSTATRRWRWSMRWRRSTERATDGRSPS